MSAPQRLLELIGLALRAGGKATAAAARQGRKNFQYKPELENAPSTSRAGSSQSGTRITSQLAMNLDEAHLILNVKKDEPLEAIQRHYEQIFSANGPPPEPVQTPAGVKRPPKPIYSHYLQSKVYRALERIKAERGEEGNGTGGGETSPVTAAGESSPVSGAAPPGS